MCTLKSDAFLLDLQDILLISFLLEIHFDLRILQNVNQFLERHSIDVVVDLDRIDKKRSQDFVVYFKACNLFFKRLKIVGDALEPVEKIISQFIRQQSYSLKLLSMHINVAILNLIGSLMGNLKIIPNFFGTSKDS